MCDRVPSSVSLLSEDLENTNSVGYIKGISVYILYIGATQIQRRLARGTLISLQLNWDSNTYILYLNERIMD